MSAPHQHPFERVGLGKAPFHLIANESRTYQACPGAPMQPGTCCDYCGTGIVDTYWLRSSDGRRFKVGSTCVGRSGDAKLKKQVDRILSEKKRERQTQRCQAAFDRLNEVRDILVKFPHPGGFVDRRTGRELTLLDWVEWMIKHSGLTGHLKVARLIEKTVADVTKGD